MKRPGLALAILAWVILCLLIAGSLIRYNYPQFLVDAAAPTCPKLVNPCAIKNCDRQDTRKLT